MKKTYVYDIWTEDTGSWAANTYAVYKTKEEALKVLRAYLKALDVEYWLEDGLAVINRVQLK